MLFYIMMLETKGILARSLSFPPGKQRLTYSIESHKREDRRKDSLRSLIGVFAVIPLLHISQISTKRIKHPGAVLKEGQEVRVKIISTANNKICCGQAFL